MKKKIIPVDFETKKIENRPVYPPIPAGVALEIDGKDEYLAWNHPTNNNCKKSEAKKILKHTFTNHIPLFHHAAFDISVAVNHMGCKRPEEFHDTLFLAYLDDPRELDLGLKPLANKYLSMPADEQEELHDWIYENIFVPNKWKVTKKNPLGAYISEAPGDLTGKYAIGDIVRTRKLFKFYMPHIIDREMIEAYDRERAVMPVFDGMSDEGICVATNRLAKDSKVWIKANQEREAWIKKRLKTPDLLISSGPQLANALDKTNKVIHWIKTEKGNRSTSRENLIKVCTDKKLVDVLSTYGKMNTFINTFALPWLESAKKYGRIYPSFNQVRSTDDQGKGRGTRTGRPSSNNPNLLNVPRNQEDPDLPNMRDYLVPDPGTSFIIADYSQQELRILAHYEEGVLFQAYTDDPTMDAHDLVRDLIHEVTGILYDRNPVKTINFGKVYGMGREGVANKIGGSLEEAAELIKAHGKALPGVKELSKEITKQAKNDCPIVTWGGREYYVEEPKFLRGRMCDFYYKLLNYLIQGSAADCTKEAMIRADKALKKLGGRLVLQVYDELVGCVPKGKEKEGLRIMRECMESIEFDVKLLTDGKIGKVSWARAKKVK